jgi:hypothetical protein
MKSSNASRWIMGEEQKLDSSSVCNFLHSTGSL